MAWEKSFLSVLSEEEALTFGDKDFLLEDVGRSLFLTGADSSGDEGGLLFFFFFLLDDGFLAGSIIR